MNVGIKMNERMLELQMTLTRRVLEGGKAMSRNSTL